MVSVAGGLVIVLTGFLSLAAGDKNGLWAAVEISDSGFDGFSYAAWRAGW